MSLAAESESIVNLFQDLPKTRYMDLLLLDTVSIASYVLRSSGDIHKLKYKNPGFKPDPSFR